jgi:large subunit ribosomal protein L9
VTSADVAEALASRDLGIDRRKIQLAEPLKTLGDHVVQVRLQPGVTADVKVKIVPAE